MRITQLNWQEPAAYAASIAAFIAGLFLGHAYDPAWLGRAGSVIIVCGVLLASSRKIDILHIKARALIDAHREKEFQPLLSEFTNPDGSPITKDQAKKLKKRIYAEAEKEIGELIEERRHVFKLHEVSIVVAGTLINGLGELTLRTVLSALIKCAA
jgi:hypothetical protein